MPVRTVSQKLINSFDPKEGRLFKGLWSRPTKNADFDLHFDKYHTPTTFACWKIRFKTEVCSCSQFLTEAMQWIKEVEMVDSVDDLKSSRSVRGTPGPNFELLDARIASALNKIIQNTRFKKKVSLEEMKSSQRRPFSSRKTNCLPGLPILLGHWNPMILSKTIPTCSLLFFEMMIFRNSILSGTKFYYQ